MDCLDEETILAYCRGGLLPEARSRAQTHVSGCDECRVLVSAVMRSSLVDDVPPPDAAMAPTTPLVGAASGPVTSPVVPGDVLAGKYEIERILGAGGMGVVVAARHLQLERRVALKFLLPAACEVPGAVARFLREGKSAAQIVSEHVAKVLDTGVLDTGAPYLVMEYLEGKDLGAVMRERGPLPPQDAVDYVLQACEAIAIAHDLGIVHRDLKPANLFLTHRADGSPLVKVLDFGISKVEGGSRSQLTSASVLMGSPRYMSPEQMLSAKDVDVRTDVWALGILLFELVTGGPVWAADTVQGLCALIASAPAPKLRERAPGAPAVLEDVVARCLVKNRDERIADVAALALALAPIAPPSARTSIDRILRLAGRERAPVVEAEASPPTTAKGARVPLVGVVTAAATVAVAVALGWRPAARVAAPPPSTVDARPAAPVAGPAPIASSAPSVAAATAASVAAVASSPPIAATAPVGSSRRPARASAPPAASSSTAAPSDASTRLPATPGSSRALSDRK